MLHSDRETIYCYGTQGFQHLEMSNYLYYSLFIVLPPRTSVLNDTLQSLSAFPTRIIKKNVPPYAKHTSITPFHNSRKMQGGLESFLAISYTEKVQFLQESMDVTAIFQDKSHLMLV